MQRVPVPIVVSEPSLTPSYQTPGSAGMDLRASEPVRLEPMQRALVPTGVRMAIPLGYEGQVRPRSGLAAKFGVSLVNTPGTIDSDYRGEIKIIMINLGQDVVSFEKGERIAQLVICPVIQADLILTDNLDDTERGSGGFGSTGV